MFDLLNKISVIVWINSICIEYVHLHHKAHMFNYNLKHWSHLIVIKMNVLLMHYIFYEYQIKYIIIERFWIEYTHYHKHFRYCAQYLQTWCYMSWILMKLLDKTLHSEMMIYLWSHDLLTNQWECIQTELNEFKSNQIILIFT